MFEKTPTSPIYDEETFNLFQTHARICSQYAKLTSQKLYLEEARRISEANDLLEKLSSREKVKDLSEWDVFTTRDSLVLEDFSISNLSNISIDNSRSKPIIRKNAMGSRTARDFDGNINTSISEIENECSPKTATFVRKLVEEYKKLKSKVQQLEKQQKSAKLRDKLLEQLQQKNLMLARKVEDSEADLERVKIENTRLRGENRELSEAIFKKSNEINSERKIKLYEEIANNKNLAAPRKAQGNGNLEILSRVVEEKENIMTMRYEEICAVEAKVENVLFREAKSCGNCCLMLKKLKGSILTYKHYLEQEGRLFDSLVDSFKQSVFPQEEL